MDIGVVIVTFNRLEKLKSALVHYHKQTKPFKYMLIIDNHSSDGTVEYLKKWEATEENYQKYCIYLDENTGGAGGFYYGMEKAKTLSADWIWISDDAASIFSKNPPILRKELKAAYHDA